MSPEKRYVLYQVYRKEMRHTQRLEQYTNSFSGDKQHFTGENGDDRMYGSSTSIQTPKQKVEGRKDGKSCGGRDDWPMGSCTVK